MAVTRFIQWLVTKASRDTTSGRFIAEIDGLRFIAIFSVIFYHMTEFVIVKTGRHGEYDPLARLLSHGNIGVQLFFVISGFVIALPFAKAHFTGGSLPQIRQYFTRRLTRLEPPYFINLLIRYTLLTVLTAKSAPNLLPHLLASMGYLHNLIYGKMSAINVVAWSLEVELQFYILAPLTTSLFMIRSKPLRRALIAALIAFFAGITFCLDQGEFPRYFLSVLPAAPYFLTGFLLVDLYLNELTAHPEKSLAWDLISLCSWLCIMLLLFLDKTGKLFIAIPILLAYCAAFKGTWSNRFFSLPVVYITGGMCYTIYLYHFSIINTVGLAIVRILKSPPLWLSIVIANLLLIPVILLLCTVLFVFIEKPCMRKDWHIQLWDFLKSALRKTVKATAESE